MEKKIIQENGDVIWQNDQKQLSRSDGPAFSNGKENRWYKNGVLEREKDLPHIETYGMSIWLKDHLVHREQDKPAKIYVTANDTSSSPDSTTVRTEEWYQKGELHREGDKPAYRSQMISGDVIEKYYQNGKLHRDNGPAITARGLNEWYKNGEKVEPSLADKVNLRISNIRDSVFGSDKTDKMKNKF